MTMLDKLKLSDKSIHTTFATPEAQARKAFLAGLDVQIAAAEAQTNGDTFIRRAKRWVDDPETGERILRDVPIKFRSWAWTDVSGKLMVTVRYGNRPLEVKPGKTSIEVGDQANLLPTLNLLRNAVVAGELDKALLAAKQSRTTSLKKAS